MKSAYYVLVACEFSGIVREAFNQISGFHATSCDLLPAEDHRHDHHFQGDVRHILRLPWDLVIAHPDCTYLCSSGLHWNKRVPGRSQLTEEALDFVRLLMNANANHICIENPVGCISTRIRPPDQYIHPYQFGHDASKKTGLWLSHLPPLTPTKIIEPRMIGGKPRWANQTDSGQNRLAPSDTRWMDRSRTYTGIAQAMATQWSEYIVNQSSIRR